MAGAKITTISGRRVTVEHNGNKGDYQILRNATITLDGKSCKLGDLDTRDEVQLGGTTVKGVKQVTATRPNADKIPESRRPETMTHFPPRKGDVSEAEERKKAMLPQAQPMSNTPQPEEPGARDKPSDSDHDTSTSTPDVEQTTDEMVDDTTGEDSHKGRTFPKGRKRH